MGPALSSAVGLSRERLSDARKYFRERERNKVGRDPGYTVVGFDLRWGRTPPSISEEAVRVSSSQEKVTFSALAFLRVATVLETEAGGEQSLGHAMMGSLSAANTQFCLDFFKELSKVKRNENIFFSPLSISAALSMVQLGAGGNTDEETEKVLHIHEVLSMASPGTKSTTGKEIVSELCDNIEL
ncbi:hypothetical protein QYF61_007444 [Mycteria americana]|uniref:Serpin domain-containing protein n=1 Tax=Mycteria americana TaxID=33587 RepID=A0AAN7NHY8_MYCAM|nr:hypothetical protein QYF61_007444 [Mycteria americana]